MNAKETQAKMDREVDLRKLVAKLDREIFGVRTTLTELQKAVHYNTTIECTIEPDGFHGKSYEAFKAAMEGES